jgi:hypothetical protein
VRQTVLISQASPPCTETAGCALAGLHSCMVHYKTSVESCKSLWQNVVKKLFWLAFLSTPHTHDFLVSIPRQCSALSTSYHRV